VTLNPFLRLKNAPLSPNCHQDRRKTGKNQQNTENWNSRYLTAGKGFRLILRQIAKYLLRFSRPPVSTLTHSSAFDFNPLRGLKGHLVFVGHG
jgi:hypothetical protein